MKTLQRVHLVLGFVGVLVFIFTGQYLKQNFPGIYESNEKIRYLFRASHIYILFISVIHIFFAFCAVFELKKIRFLYFISSLALILSLALLVVEFYLVPQNLMKRSFTLYSLILMLVGAGSYLVYYWWGSRTK